MGKRTKYGEPTTMMSFRVPNSMMDRIRDIVYLSIDKMQTDKPKISIDNIIFADVVKNIKTPAETKFVPFTAKKIMVEGYACLKDEDSEVCYWRDSATTALIFDNEVHLKSYLIKFKP